MKELIEKLNSLLGDISKLYEEYEGSEKAPHKMKTDIRKSFQEVKLLAQKGRDEILSDFKERFMKK
jgi:hypothetical protein